MKRYVCGFLFNMEMTKVVLIKKNRPDWQKGKLNGVGGHIEEGEYSFSAMVREFKEETGLLIENWKDFCNMTAEDNRFEVHFYYSTYKNIEEVKTITDEEIKIVNIDDLFVLPVIDNLRWLIPMCLDPYNKFAVTKSK